MIIITLIYAGRICGKIPQWIFVIQEQKANVQNGRKNVPDKVNTIIKGSMGRKVTAGGMMDICKGWWCNKTYIPTVIWANLVHFIYILTEVYFSLP